jgi:hypothetical protein
MNFLECPDLNSIQRERQLQRRARIAAILTDAIRREIVTAAANEAGLVIQLDAVRPFSSPAFAAPVLLYGMADEIVVAM